MAGLGEEEVIGGELGSPGYVANKEGEEEVIGEREEGRAGKQG